MSKDNKPNLDGLQSSPPTEPTELVPRWLNELSARSAAQGILRHFGYLAREPKEHPSIAQPIERPTSPSSTFNISSTRQINLASHTSDVAVSFGLSARTPLVGRGTESTLPTQIDANHIQTERQLGTAAGAEFTQTVNPTSLAQFMTTFASATPIEQPRTAAAGTELDPSLTLHTIGNWNAYRNSRSMLFTNVRHDTSRAVERNPNQYWRASTLTVDSSSILGMSPGNRPPESVFAEVATTLVGSIASFQVATNPESSIQVDRPSENPALLSGSAHEYPSSPSVARTMQLLQQAENLSLKLRNPVSNNQAEQESSTVQRYSVHRTSPETAEVHDPGHLVRASSPATSEPIAPETGSITDLNWTCGLGITSGAFGLSAIPVLGRLGGGINLAIPGYDARRASHTEVFSAINTAASTLDNLPAQRRLSDIPPFSTIADPHSAASVTPGSRELPPTAHQAAKTELTVALHAPIAEADPTAFIQVPRQDLPGPMVRELEVITYNAVDSLNTFMDRLAAALTVAERREPAVEQLTQAAQRAIAGDTAALRQVRESLENMSPSTADRVRPLVRELETPISRAAVWQESAIATHEAVCAVRRFVDQLRVSLSTPEQEGEEVSTFIQSLERTARGESNAREMRESLARLPENIGVRLQPLLTQIEPSLSRAAMLQETTTMRAAEDAIQELTRRAAERASPSSDSPALQDLRLTDTRTADHVRRQTPGFISISTTEESRSEPPLQRASAPAPEQLAELYIAGGAFDDRPRSRLNTQLPIVQPLHISGISPSESNGRSLSQGEQSSHEVSVTSTQVRSTERSALSPVTLSFGTVSSVPLERSAAASPPLQRASFQASTDRRPTLPATTIAQQSRVAESQQYTVTTYPAIAVDLQHHSSEALTSVNPAASSRSERDSVHIHSNFIQWQQRAMRFAAVRTIQPEISSLTTAISEAPIGSREGRQGQVDKPVMPSVDTNLGGLVTRPGELQTTVRRVGPPSQETVYFRVSQPTIQNQPIVLEGSTGLREDSRTTGLQFRVEGLRSRSTAVDAVLPIGMPLSDHAPVTAQNAVLNKPLPEISAAPLLLPAFDPSLPTQVRPDYLRAAMSEQLRLPENRIPDNLPLPEQRRTPPPEPNRSADLLAPYRDNMPPRTADWARAVTRTADLLRIVPCGEIGRPLEPRTLIQEQHRASEWSNRARIDRNDLARAWEIAAAIQRQGEVPSTLVPLSEPVSQVTPGVALHDERTMPRSSFHNSLFIDPISIVQPASNRLVRASSPTEPAPQRVELSPDASIAAAPAQTGPQRTSGLNARPPAQPDIAPAAANSPQAEQAGRYETAAARLASLERAPVDQLPAMLKLHHTGLQMYEGLVRLNNGLAGLGSGGGNYRAALAYIQQCAQQLRSTLSQISPEDVIELRSIRQLLETSISTAGMNSQTVVALRRRLFSLDEMLKLVDGENHRTSSPARQSELQARLNVLDAEGATGRWALQDPPRDDPAWHPNMTDAERIRWHTHQRERVLQELAEISGTQRRQQFDALLERLVLAEFSTEEEFQEWLRKNRFVGLAALARETIAAELLLTGAVESPSSSEREPANTITVGIGVDQQTAPPVVSPPPAIEAGQFARIVLPPSLDQPVAPARLAHGPVLEAPRLELRRPTDYKGGREHEDLAHVVPLKSNLPPPSASLTTKVSQPQDPQAADSDLSLQVTPKIWLDSEEFDFDEVTDGAIVEHTFKVTNVGNGELVLAEPIANGGFTFPKLDKKRLLAGETTGLSVTIDTSSRAERVFVLLQSNDMSKPVVTLILSMSINNAEDTGQSKTEL